MNPYLGVAASLAAGLYGIENKLELKQEMIKGNAYDCELAPAFPQNLQDAAMAFAESSIAKDLFGADFVAHFAQSRLWEWQQCQQAVTDWELKRYFEII